ncbi:MAG: protein-export chaperone SecB [Hyphomicrobium sp.]
MADEQKSKNGGGAAATEKQTAGFQAQVVAQYVKDLSFENPNVSKLLGGPGDDPSMSIEVSVNGQRMNKPDLYESAIDLRAKATNKAGTIYIFECVYAGLFQLKNIPEPALEPFLLVNCPTLIFPFLRRLAADVTREGGFPPLLLDPMDFGALYVRRQQEQATAQASSKLKS